MTPKKPIQKVTRKHPSRRQRIRTLHKPGMPHVKRTKRGGEDKRSQKSGFKTNQKHANKKKIHISSTKRMRPPKFRSIRETKGINEKRSDKIPPLKHGDIRIVPLGGVEQIGKNMTVVEYKDDIIIIDAGLQFAEVETPGVDYIIPDVSYLEKRKDKIRGIFITHGHLDHIGAIPYIAERLGNPPIYTREFGTMMMLKRQDEFPQLAKLDIKSLTGDETIKLKNITLKFFIVDHSIPDAMGIIIETEIGDIVTTGDVKIDHVDGVPTKREQEIYSIFKDRNVLLLMLDSTNVENPGFSMAEPEVIKNVEKIFAKTKGRLIIATFASQIDRMVGFIKLAEKYNRKVIMEGRSMKTNIEIARKLGLVKTNHIISVKEMDEYPPERILMLATGAQGEEFAALMRMANNTHKTIKLQPSDTIILSASIIPGNEQTITKLKDNLYRHEARVITYREFGVHASGHGNRDELKWIHEQIPYKFFMPIHGHHFMLRIHAEMAMRELGVSRKNIVVPDNGSVIDISSDGKSIQVRKEQAMVDKVMVDGFSVGGSKEVVIRDRKNLAQDGMFIIIASIDPRTGKLRKSPDIVSRGFVYLREEQKLLNETRAIIQRTVEKTAKGMRPINFDMVKAAVVDEVRKHLFQNTAKNPMIIPVIIGV